MKGSKGSPCPRVGWRRLQGKRGASRGSVSTGRSWGDREAKGGERTGDVSRLTKDQREGLRGISDASPRRPHAASPCSLGGVATDTRGVQK